MKRTKFIINRKGTYTALQGTLGFDLDATNLEDAKKEFAVMQQKMNREFSKRLIVLK